MKKGLVDHKAFISAESIKIVFQRFHAHNPEPKCELYYTQAYTLLVAVVLSAQSTDRSVNLITPALFKRAETPQRMLELSEETLHGYIRTLGLYQRKAMYILELSQQLITRHKGEVPDSFPALTALSGVGGKTANVILNVWFHRPTIPVDTHVFRVAKRLGFASGATPEKVEKELQACIPDLWKKHAHGWLVLHGRMVCKARTPHCSVCMLKDLCPSSTHKH